MRHRFKGVYGNSEIWFLVCAAKIPQNDWVNWFCSQSFVLDIISARVTVLFVNTGEKPGMAEALPRLLCSQFMSYDMFHIAVPWLTSVEIYSPVVLPYSSPVCLYGYEWWAGLAGWIFCFCCWLLGIVSRVNPLWLHACVACLGWLGIPDKSLVHRGSL